MATKKPKKEKSGTKASGLDRLAIAITKAQKFFGNTAKKLEAWGQPLPKDCTVDEALEHLVDLKDQGFEPPKPARRGVEFVEGDSVTIKPDAIAFVQSVFGVTKRDLEDIKVSHVTVDGEGPRARKTVTCETESGLKIVLPPAKLIKKGE